MTSRLPSRLRPAGKDEPDLSHVAGLRGATPVDKLAAAFSLPYAGRLDGAVSWAATARVPKDKDQQPFRIEIESDLAGLVSTLGAPLQKAADIAGAAAAVGTVPGA